MARKRPPICVCAGRVVVYNMVNKNTSVVWLEKDNQLGAATCTLSEILRSPGQVLTLPLECVPVAEIFRGAVSLGSCAAMFSVA